MAFTFDPTAGRYRDSAGRLVPDATVRRALDQVIDAQAATMRALTEGMLLGTVALADWQLSMLALIKSSHIAAVAVAHGGWNQLDQEALGWVGSQIKPQYRFLVRFSIEVGSGAQKLDGTAVARSALYAQAARGTHREAERLAAAQRRAGEEKSNLGVADHCKLCVSEARKGWVPFGTLILPGRRTCLVNCRCWLTFRASQAA